MGGLASGLAEVEGWTLLQLIESHLVLDYREAVERAKVPKKPKGTR